VADSTWRHDVTDALQSDSVGLRTHQLYQMSPVSNRL
jgi:hypothetical protein